MIRNQKKEKEDTAAIITPGQSDEGAGAVAPNLPIPESRNGSSDGLMQDSASPSTPVAPSDNSTSVKENSALDNTMDTGETLSGEQNDTATLQDTVSNNKGSEISGENNTPAENPTVEAIKRQAVREGGQILVLPSEEEAGGLPSRTHELSSGSKDSENPEETNTPERKRAACLRPAGWEIGSRQHFASFYQSR